MKGGWDGFEKNMKVVMFVVFGGEEGSGPEPNGIMGKVC